MRKGLTVVAMVMLSGCSLMHKSSPAPETLHYRCGTLPLTVTLDNAKDQVSFIMDGKPLTLTQTVSASGPATATDSMFSGLKETVLLLSATIKSS